ncbi:MAG: exonuclease SbcCD subunit D [Candidatus Nezhaarchaeota archaeon]|nr:exonuclease SbcCD subunit D [Candidatus Nezhaarchaeota archaeon]
MLIAHLSDNHLGYRQYGLLEREKDLYTCFEEAITKAIEEHVDMVIHSGDLFHSPNPPPQAYKAVLNALKRLKQRGIPFLYIMGQHDRPKVQALAPALIFEDMDLLIHVSEKPYVSGDYSVVGLDYARKQVLKDKLGSLKPPVKKNVLLTHVLLKEISPLGDISIQELPKGFTYYALGDYHIFKTFSVHGSIAAYPGSSEVISLNDLTNMGKGFCFVDLSGDEARVQFQKLESVRPRIVAEVEFNSVKDFVAKLFSQVTSMRLKPLIHLTVRGIGIKRRDLDKVREELSKISLRTFISVEEEGIELPSVTGASFSGIEEIIHALFPSGGDALVELYRAFRLGTLHSELERLLRTGEWMKLLPQQYKAETTPKPLKPTHSPTKSKESTILEWLKHDSGKT